MKNIVVDTNVIISSVISPLGNASEIMNMIFDCKLKPFYCEEILTEYKEVLSRKNSA